VGNRATAVLTHSRLVVVPLLEFDPFPTVLLEAGQVGGACPCANIGGIPEIVVEGQTGLLFDPDDPRAACGQVGPTYGGI